MNCIVTKTEMDGQDLIVVYVDIMDTNTHTVTSHELVFSHYVFIDCTPDEKIDIIRRALRDKMISELNIADLVGEQFTLDTLYRKAFA